MEKKWPPSQSVFFPELENLAPRDIKKYGYRLTRGMEYRLYSMPEIDKLIEEGKIVPVIERPKKQKGVLPPMTPEYIELQLGSAHLYFTLQRLQGMIADIRSLQAVLTEYDVVVSWDDEKKKVVVAARPKPEKSKTD